LSNEVISDKYWRSVLIILSEISVSNVKDTVVYISLDH